MTMGPPPPPHSAAIPTTNRVVRIYGGRFVGSYSPEARASRQAPCRGLANFRLTDRNGRNIAQMEERQPFGALSGDRAHPHLFDNWFDPIGTEVRGRARQFIEELIRIELDTALSRPRYGRGKTANGEERTGVTGHRHGSWTRSLAGTFGRIEIEVPHARLNTAGARRRYEGPGAASLSAAHAGRRRADCKRLSGRHQHAPSSRRACRSVRRRGRRGHGEPDLAQGEDAIGISRGKTDRLRRTPAGFTTPVLDGRGLRDQWLARPAG
jgi:hypothetical protein